MTKLKVKLLAFEGAADAVFENAVNRIEKLIPPGNFSLAESDPDILFFLSGGSELPATKQVAVGHFYLLIGSRHDNSYASAAEVKAYLNARNIRALLLDEEEGETIEILKEFFIVKQALKNLQGKRLGLIGQVSDWLIASSIPSGILQSKLGIDLTQITQ